MSATSLPCLAPLPALPPVPGVYTYGAAGCVEPHGSVRAQLSKGAWRIRHAVAALGAGRVLEQGRGRQWGVGVGVSCGHARACTDLVVQRLACRARALFARAKRPEILRRFWHLRIMRPPCIAATAENAEATENKRFGPTPRPSHAHVGAGCVPQEQRTPLGIASTPAGTRASSGSLGRWTGRHTTLS